MKDTRLHIFLHIHKTGGSTIQKIISRNYPKKSALHIPHLKASDLYMNLSPDEKKRIHIVKGHFPFGIHSNANADSFTYFSMLRNPVDRLISAYYYVLERPHLPIYAQVTSKNLSLSEFMTSGIKGIIENGQTKMIAGMLDMEYGSCNEEVYLKAVDNIEKYFSVVGLSEQFDESALLMAKELGWKKTWYTRANITKNKPKRSTFSKDEIEIIEKYNQWDIKLVEYCKFRLQKQWNQNTDLHGQLERYKKKNRTMEKLKKIKNIFSRS
ncbi:MAG: sulfotransferase family 2 domain-containing protein [Flavobacteriales bacterium]